MVKGLPSSLMKLLDEQQGSRDSMTPVLHLALQAGVDAVQVRNLNTRNWGYSVPPVREVHGSNKINLCNFFGNNLSCY